MIVAQFNVVGVLSLKPKTQPPLTVDRYGIVPEAIPLQSMEPVAWRNTHVFDRLGSIKHIEFSQRARNNLWRKPLYGAVAEQSFRTFVTKALYHIESVTHNVTHYKDKPHLLYGARL